MPIICLADYFAASSLFICQMWAVESYQCWWTWNVAQFVVAMPHRLSSIQQHHVWIPPKQGLQKLSYVGHFVASSVGTETNKLVFGISASRLKSETLRWPLASIWSIRRNLGPILFWLFEFRNIDLFAPIGCITMIMQARRSENCESSNKVGSVRRQNVCSLILLIDRGGLLFPSGSQMIFWFLSWDEYEWRSWMQ